MQFCESSVDSAEALSNMEDRCRHYPAGETEILKLRCIKKLQPDLVEHQSAIVDKSSSVEALFEPASSSKAKSKSSMQSANNENNCDFSTSMPSVGSYTTSPEVSRFLARTSIAALILEGLRIVRLIDVQRYLSHLNALKRKRGGCGELKEYCFHRLMIQILFKSATG